MNEPVSIFYKVKKEKSKLVPIKEILKFQTEKDFFRNNLQNNLEKSDNKKLTIFLSSLSMSGNLHEIQSFLAKRYGCNKEKLKEDFLKALQDLPLHKCQNLWKAYHIIIGE